MRRPGTDAEDLAANYLLGQGYTLLTRRYRCPGGEIDLVALDQDTVVFVEVKSRSGRHEHAEQAITARKWPHLRHAVAHYVSTHALRQPTRFDVIAITGDRLSHYAGVPAPDARDSWAEESAVPTENLWESDPANP